jgi:glycosyltransferase involved in cell wall biosynthesis
MLSWEYPPKNIGGLSNHVYYLSKSLKAMGHEVHVITCAAEDAPFEEECSGVNVHRVSPYSLDGEDFTKWIMHLNFAMAEEAVKLVQKVGKFSVVHVHDWLTMYCGKLIKNTFNIPMVSTIHATEHGRNGGVRTEMQRYISSAEWMLAYEAWKVIVCSEYMGKEVSGVFNVPSDKISLIPNGVEYSSFSLEFNQEEFRRSYAKDDEKLIFYVGRHVYEKGIQVLVEAAPDIINSCPNAKFVIAGQGPMTEELKEKVKFFGLQEKFVFAGYIDEEEKTKLFKVSQMAVFPSLYEPFGIVALEAMAAGCPVVASDVGGLQEIILHEANGLKVIPGSRDSLKENVIRLLNDDEFGKKLSECSKQVVMEKYAWEKVAMATIELYEKIGKEAKGSSWETKETRVRKTSAVKKAKAETEQEEAKREAEVKVKRTRKKTAN